MKIINDSRRKTYFVQRKTSAINTYIAGPTNGAHRMGKTYRRNDDNFKRPKRNNKLNKFEGKSKPSKFNKNKLHEMNEEE